MPGQIEVFEERFSGAPIRIQRASRTPAKFGPYDYLFIDAPSHDAPIDLVLASLLDVLEVHAELVRAIDPLLGGIRVSVVSSGSKYSEEIDTTTFARLAKLNLRATLAFEHSLEAEVSGDSPSLTNY